MQQKNLEYQNAPSIEKSNCSNFNLLNQAGNLQQILTRMGCSNIRILILSLISIVVLTGCYTFKGFSISDDLTSFYVADFRTIASNAPPTISQTFAEQLKLKILRESRLNFNDLDPDIEFGGTVSNFRDYAVSPEPGEFSAFNRLEITISIQYTNHRDEEDTWNQSFSHFMDFGAQDNLLDVQEDLIDQIFELIIEDIFNKAFTNW